MDTTWRLQGQETPDPHFPLVKVIEGSPEEEKGKKGAVFSVEPVTLPKNIF